MKNMKNMKNTENMILAKKYFKIWRDIVSYKKYDEWCEINQEYLNELQFAMDNEMDSVHWCWNCKYSDCSVH